MTPPLVLVAGVARNGVIGNAKTMPWRLPGDLRHFRSLSMGKPVLMGRRTYESIGKPLTGRQTIVLTRDKRFHPPNVLCAGTLDEALWIAAEVARHMSADAVIGAGGGEIYAGLMDRADRLDLTEIALEPPGDTHFPSIDPTIWRETSRVAADRQAGDEADYAFVRYERK